MWESLDSDLKSVVTAANTAVNQMVLSEFVARNNASLDVLKNKHKVMVKRFPNEILNQLGGIAGDVVGQLANKYKLGREVFDSLIAFRRTSIAWSNLSERAFLSARALPSKYGG